MQRARSMGDNHELLLRYVQDESVDLIYLDPPFNLRQGYSDLFATDQTVQPGLATGNQADQ